MAHGTRARHSTHDAGAQRAANASFDPADVTDEFVKQIPVLMLWFLSRAVSASLDGATIAWVVGSSDMSRG